MRAGNEYSRLANGISAAWLPPRRAASLWATRSPTAESGRRRRKLVAASPLLLATKTASQSRRRAAREERKKKQKHKRQHCCPAMHCTPLVDGCNERRRLGTWVLSGCLGLRFPAYLDYNVTHTYIGALAALGATHPGGKRGRRSHESCTRSARLSSTHHLPKKHGATIMVLIKSKSFPHRELNPGLTGNL